MRSDLPWYLWVFVVGLSGFFTWCVVYGVVYVRAERTCLKLGYPQARVTAIFDQYCIIRVDQSDIVVPLVKSTPRR